MRGRTVETTVSHVGGVTRLGAYALCERSDGRLLLCRLSEGQPEAGVWTIPGGAVEFGEDPGVAALRELREEAGLEGHITSVAGIYSHIWDRSPFAAGQRLHVVGIVYRVTVQPGDLRPEVAGSTDECRWVQRSGVAQLATGPLLRFALQLQPERKAFR
jgi:8-oxo-dGTP diphosphatase